METNIVLRILLTVVIGGILGLETETRQKIKSSFDQSEKEKKRLGGVRTYTVLSIFGGIAGLFYYKEEIAMVYLFFISVLLFTLVAYYMDIKLEGSFGLTTEIALMMTFALGFLTTSFLIDIPVVLIILVLLTFFLSQKKGISAIVNRIKHQEVINILQFCIVAVVILPLLPQRNIFIFDLFPSLLELDFVPRSFSEAIIINPFNVWLVVVIISGLNLLVYFLRRIFGKLKGTLISSVIGGIISSTGATIAFARESKNEPYNSGIFSGAALLANGLSFFQVAIVVLVLNKIYFEELLPALLLMLLTASFLGITKIIKSGKELTTKSEYVSPVFSIGPALKFVFIIIVVTLLVQILQAINVSPVVLILVTAFSGLTGIDAPTIAFAGLISNSSITIEIGVWAFVLTNFINIVGKIIYSRSFGAKNFYLAVKYGLIITALIGVLGVWF